MKNSPEQQFITDFCNKIKVEQASKRDIAEQVYEAGYRLDVQQPTADSRANDNRLETDLNECIGQASAEEWKPYVNAEIEWNESRRWFPGTVIAITDEWIIIKDKRGNEGSYYRDGLSIRPIDFERNDMAEIIKKAAEKYQGLVHINKFIADDLYAAGYRKQ